jgi:hypothetical protein
MRRDESVCERFVQAERYALAHDSTLQLTTDARWLRCDRREPRRDGIVATHPRNLFDQVDFAFDVGSVRRAANLPAVVLGLFTAKA